MSISDRRSLFLRKLPLELRQRIYAEVVVSFDPVHIFQRGDFSSKQLCLAICPDAKGQNPRWNCCDEGSNKRLGIKTLQTSLIALSPEIKDEVLPVILGLNTIHFGRLDLCTWSLRWLGSYCKGLRSVVLTWEIYDLPPSYDISQPGSTDAVRFCEKAPQVSQLKMIVDIEPSLDPEAFWVEGILNHFRPFSILPLTGVDLHLRSVPVACKSRIDFGQLKEQAVRIMLGDSQHPSAKEVPIPKKFVRMLKAKEERENPKVDVSSSLQHVERY